MASLVEGFTGQCRRVSSQLIRCMEIYYDTESNRLHRNLHIVENSPLLLKLWKVANSAKLEMRPRGTGDQLGIKGRDKTKDRQT